MDQLALQTLLEKVRDSQVTPDEAMHRLRHLPFEDIGFAKIDHHRPLRIGMPEVIYSAGKTPEHVAEIFARMAERASNVLATAPIAKSSRQSTHAYRKQNFIQFRDASSCDGMAKSEGAA